MSLFDPSKTLPFEIMSQIFAFSMGLRGPWFLGAVCKSWRTIAWSSPELWTNLHIHWDRWKKENRPLIIGIASQWLTRAGNLPLAFDIKGCSWNDDSFTDEVLPLFDLLGEYMGRCHTLILKGFNVNDFIRVFRKIDTQSCTETDSILEYLELGFYDASHLVGRRRNQSEPYFLDLSGHRRLSTIILNDLFPSQLQIHWSKLTEARLWHPSLVLDELMDLLETAPQLIHCQVNYLGRHTRPNFLLFYSSHRLIHHHLRVLSLVTDPCAVEILFPAITLPSLDDLSVVSNHLIHFPTYIMTSFIERSGCMLRTLRAGFDIDSVNGEDFNRFLQVTSPHLTSLHLSSVTDSFFNRLAIKSEDWGHNLPFLPFLETFSYSGPRTFSWRAFERSLWRFEASTSTHRCPHTHRVVVGGLVYVYLVSEFEILDEKLTRRLVAMPVDIFCGRNNLIADSLCHWDKNGGQTVDEN